GLDRFVGDGREPVRALLSGLAFFDRELGARCGLHRDWDQRGARAQVVFRAGRWLAQARGAEPRVAYEQLGTLLTAVFDLVHASRHAIALHDQFAGLDLEQARAELQILPLA